MASKIIKVACEGADVIGIDEIEIIQGDLKELSMEDFGALREEIVKRGFSAPFFIWKSGKRRVLLDGTQRLLTLRKMRDEGGWTVPALPCAWIHAKDEAEARQKLLAFVAQFGRVTEQGMYEYLHKSGFDYTALDNFSLPGFDVPTFAGAYFEVPASTTQEAGTELGNPSNGKEPATGSKEIGKESFDDLNHKCPRCGFPLKAQSAAAE